MSTFCPRSYHRNCQHRGGRWSKKAKILSTSFVNDPLKNGFFKKSLQKDEPLTSFNTFLSIFVITFGWDCCCNSRSDFLQNPYFSKIFKRNLVKTHYLNIYTYIYNFRMAHGGMSMTIKATSSPTMNTIRMRPKKLHSVLFISKVLKTTVKKTILWSLLRALFY